MKSRLIFISNLLVHSAEKILLLNPTNFRGDYQGVYKSRGYSTAAFPAGEDESIVAMGEWWIWSDN
jgi:hypothetical protein